MKQLSLTEICQVSGGITQVTDKTVPPQCAAYVVNLFDGLVDLALFDIMDTQEGGTLLYYLLRMPSSPCTYANANKAMDSLTY